MTKEMALTTCRQKVTICEVGTIPSFTGISAMSATSTRTVVQASLTAAEKCSWVASSSLGAPTFKVSTATAPLDSKYMIHYIEYSSAATRKSSGAWLDGANTGLVDGVQKTNVVYGKYYNNYADYSTY